MTTAPILKITGLNKHFGGITATDNVNLSVAQGNIHAIIGPNGAGKTTLIAQLSGQIKPDSGEIEFDGHRIVNDSMARRARLGLARSFQITSVIMPISLLENVMLAVQAGSGHSFRFWSPVRQDHTITAAAMASLAEVGLEHRATCLAANVSHGERRQLEIAMVLAMKPHLLLLDEPMAGMSREEGAMMIDRLHQLKGDITIVLVEHDMDAVFSLADQVSVMVNGHIIATDTVAQIRNNAEVQTAYLGHANA